MIELRLTILQGLPASGKSTRAKWMVENIPNCVRVNKDSLREMLTCMPWSPDIEKTVVELEYKMVFTLLEEGKHVVVDDTNLNPVHLKEYKKIAEVIESSQGVRVMLEVIRIDTPWEECVRRDAARGLTQMPGRSVGQTVIYNMAKQYGLVLDHSADNVIRTPEKESHPWKH